MRPDQSRTKTVVIERDLRFPAERVWRALTDPHLMADWLMETDFIPQEGADFGFAAPFGRIDCHVLTIIPMEKLAYRWQALGLDSVVTFTLLPIDGGVRLRMEQSGFTREQGRAYGGARDGWTGFLDNLAAQLDRRS